MRPSLVMILVIKKPRDPYEVQDFSPDQVMRTSPVCLMLW